MLNTAVYAARQAAKIIVRSFDRLDTLQVTEKDPSDFVTQVDELAEQEIIQIIQKAYPDHGILAEESGAQKGEADFVWIIDPLDGTTNYIHGFPQFAISIALQHRDRLKVAVVYDPLRQELFTAVDGSGAQLNNRKIRVSRCLQLHTALLGTGFPFKEMDLLKPYLKTFENFLPKVSGVRRAGAASLDLAYVACGRLDGFWEMKLQPWDMAAGILLIIEAGGLVGDFKGENNYIETGNLLAGNSKIFKEMLGVINSAR